MNFNGAEFFFWTDTSIFFTEVSGELLFFLWIESLLSLVCHSSCVIDDCQSLMAILRLTCCYLLNLHFGLETSDHIVSLLSVHLRLLESVQKFLHTHETAANFDTRIFAVVHFDENFPLSKLVNTFWLSQEHDFHFFFLRISVDEWSQCLIDRVILLGNVTIKKCINITLQIVNGALRFVKLHLLLIKFNLMFNLNEFQLRLKFILNSNQFNQHRINLSINGKISKGFYSKFIWNR